MKSVSFDFDGTLGHRLDVQEFCKELMRDRYSDVAIYITTRRYGPENANKTKDEQPNSDWWASKGSANWEEVFELADEFGIRRSAIHFCNMEAKEDYFKSGAPGDYFYLHLDDDKLEVDDINMNTGVYCINVTEPNWKIKAQQLLNQK